jgi:hypothetical protein
LLTTAAHACAEPIPSGGSPSGDDGFGSVVFSDTYSIQSATLPDGAPVGIEFCALADLHHQENDAIIETSTSTSATSATFGAGITGNAGSATGTFSYRDSLAGPMKSFTGTLFNDLDQFTLNLAVGQTFQVTAELSCDTTCDVIPGDDADVQAQADLVWGGAANLAGVNLVSINTGQPMPDMSDCNSQYADGNVPPPLIDVPEPSTPGLMIAVTACALLCRRPKIGVARAGK